MGFLDLTPRPLKRPPGLINEACRLRGWDKFRNPAARNSTVDTQQPATVGMVGQTAVVLFFPWMKIRKLSKIKILKADFLQCFW